MVVPERTVSSRVPEAASLEAVNRDPLQAVYARIPKIACQRKCQEYCGPITLTELEYARIFGERKQPRMLLGFPLMEDPVSGNCPKLGRDGACRVYELRPAICRLWGVAIGMPCPYGCLPERLLSNQEAYEILDAVKRLSESRNDPTAGLTA